MGMKTIKAVNTIGRDKKQYPPGSILELPKKEADRLIGLGAAKAVKKTEPAPEPEKETPPPDTKDASGETDKPKPETPKAKSAKGKGK